MRRRRMHLSLLQAVVCVTTWSFQFSTSAEMLRAAVAGPKRSANQDNIIHQHSNHKDSVVFATNSFRIHREQAQEARSLLDLGELLPPPPPNATTAVDGEGDPVPDEQPAENQGPPPEPQQPAENDAEPDDGGPEQTAPEDDSETTQQPTQGPGRSEEPDEEQEPTPVASEQTAEAQGDAQQPAQDEQQPSEGNSTLYSYSNSTSDTLAQPGDFANLNELLDGAVISLPDADIAEEVLFQNMKIKLRNGECSHVGFDDIKVTSEFQSNQEVGVDITMVNLGIQCEFDFAWTYIFLDGSGHLVATVGNSSADIGLNLLSTDFQLFPPDNATVTECVTDINIVGLEFSGNVAAVIFNMFEEMIIEVLDGLLDDKICGEFQSAGAEMLAEGLDELYMLMEPYLHPVEDWRYNVTHPEFTMVVPDDVELLSWNDDSSLGQFFDAALDEMENVLGSLQADEFAPDVTLTFPNGTEYPGGYDLGINVLLRNYLLEEDRAFVVDAANLNEMGASSMVVDLHNQVTETKVWLESLRVDGLDTFTNFKPFKRFGNFTLQNALSWDHLSFEMLVKMEMKASSLEDSIIRDPENRVEPYVEEVKFQIGIKNIDAVISVMIALDPARMKSLKLGSVLDLTTMLPCMAASLHDIALAGFNISIGDIQPPTFDGLISPGLDRLLTDTIDLLFFMYKGTLLQAIPSLFESTIRDLVTDALEGLACPPLVVPETDTYLDLRDLLLDPNEAEEAGATGLAPYGDLAASVYSIGQGMWQEVLDDGTLGLNPILIQPATLASSGQPGLVRVPDELYNVTMENEGDYGSLVKLFEFSLYDLRVANIDTIVHPMALIQPVNHPFITQSTINVGPQPNRPLSATMAMRMALDIVDSPLTMADNVVDLGISVSSLEIFFEALAMASTNNFLEYELGDGVNVNCWFSLFPPPELDTKGYRIEGSEDRGIELRRVLMGISDLKVSMDCVKCSPGLASLSDITDIWDRKGVTDVLSYRLPLFVEELAVSDPLQIAFDRWLTEAPYKCPHRPEYNTNYERPETWEIPEFTKLSVEASDTIFFTVFAMLEPIVAVAVETHYQWDLNPLDPLSGQRNFTAPENSNLFDWTRIGDGLDNFREDFRNYFGAVREDKKRGGEDLGVNIFVREYLGADEKGVVDFVQVAGGTPMEFSAQGVIIMFHSLKFLGLDSFTRFDVLKPISPQTILNSLHMRNLEIEMDISTGPRTDPPQHIIVKFGFQDFNASIPLFAAIDQNVLQYLELGHLLWGDGILPCLMTAAINLHFPQVLVTVSNWSAPTFEGFLPDSGQALRESWAEIYHKYGERMLKALPIMFDVTGRSFVNLFFTNFIRDSVNCTHITEVMEEQTLVTETPYPYADFVDVRELLLRPENASEYGARGNSTYGDVARGLTGPLNEEILQVNPETGLSNVNQFLGPLTEMVSGEPGVFVQKGHILSVPFDASIGPLRANITLSIGDLRIENVDTMGDPLSLLMPVFMSRYVLANSVGVGLGGRPLRLSMRVSLNILKIDYDTNDIQKNITNDMIVSLDLHEAKTLFNLFITMSEDRFVHFPLRHILIPACWVSLLPAPQLNEKGVRISEEASSLSLTELSISVSKLNLTLQCLKCESPGMQGLVEGFALPEAVESLTKIGNAVLRFGSKLLTGNLVQDQIDRLLNDAARMCPHDPSYVPGAKRMIYEPLEFNGSSETSSVVILLVGVAAAVLCVIILTSVFVKCVVKRRHRKWLRTLPAMRVHMLQRQQDAEKQMETELNQQTKALIWAEEIPARVRYLMPVIILGNVAFFLSGHFNVAARVGLVIEVAGEPFSIDSFYEFTVMGSTKSMWDAGAKIMSVFVMTFSGIWPYVKQSISLWCWFAPPNRYSISTRGSTLLWLDTLAKWSMVDIFVMVISMVAFRTKALTPDAPFLPEDFFSLEFTLLPEWGLYANLLAQIISQVSSHYIIYYHRRVASRAFKQYQERHSPAKLKVLSLSKTVDSEETGCEVVGRESNRLCDVAFARPHKGESSKLVVRQIASYGVVFGTIIIIVFLIVGCSIASFNVTIQGIVGFLSMGAGTGVYNEFSLFSMLGLLMRDAIGYGTFNYICGYLLLIIVMIVTVFIVPILQCLALVQHWFRSMNDKERKRSSVLIEILTAWQYAEVYIFALFVGAWQLAPTSAMMMAEQCDEFDSMFEVLTYYGVVGTEDGHCFRADPSLMGGSYLLITAAVLLALADSFVMKASFQYFFDEESITKELAMEYHHLTPAEAATPVDEETFKKIYPPPVLFTDTFRWLLRAEHLGDRPPQGTMVQNQQQGTALDQEQDCSDSSITIRQEVDDHTVASA